MEGLANNPENSLSLKDVALTRTYMVAAGSEVKNDNGTWVHGLALADKAQAVTTESDGMLKLMQTHISSYLGQGPHVARAPAAEAVTPQAGEFPTGFNAMPAMMTEFAKQIQTIEKAKTKKAYEGVLLTEFMSAALKGFAGVVDDGSLPVFYALLKTTNEPGDVRSYIMSAMEKWSNYNGIKIEKNMFLPEETVKNIMKVKPNPMETVAMSTTTDLGISNMLCLPRKTKEIEEKLMWEQAGRETEMNGTEAQGRIARAAFQFWLIEVNVATTAALLSVLYGEQCQLYINLMKIYDILQENSVQQQKGAFTRLFCRQIAWAIYDDMRNYFSKRVMPEQLMTGRGCFPTSYMEDFFSDINYVSKAHHSIHLPNCVA